VSVWELAFVIFGDFFLRFCQNFFNFIPFFMIFNALNAPIGGVQVLFRCQKQWSPPFGFGLP